MKKEYSILLIAGIFVLVWSVLLWKGQYILPAVEWFRSVIPIWIIIISAVAFFITGTLIIQKNDFLIKGTIILLTGFLLSMFIIRVSYQRFPLVAFLTLFVAILFNLVLIKIRLKIKKKNGRKT